MHRRCVLGLSIGALFTPLRLLRLGSAVSGPPSFEVVDLGLLEFTQEARDKAGFPCPASSGAASWFSGRVTSVNAAGVVTGEEAWSSVPGAAVRIANGTMERLESGPGGGGGNDINAAGQVVGYVTDPVDPLELENCDFPPISTPRHAAMWLDDALVLLPDNGAQSSEAVAINDAGTIIGVLVNPRLGEPGSDLEIPVMWRDGELIELPPLEIPPKARLYALNNADQIVGLVFLEDGTQSGIHWENGHPAALPDGFVPSDINDDGVMIGQTRTWPRGARIVNGTVDYMSGLPDYAFSAEPRAINNRGEVVGLIEITKGERQLTYWDVSGEAFDLASLIRGDAEWTFTVPIDINDSGVVLTYALDGQDQLHGLLLVPITS